jgi:hypothetical protein
VKRGVLTLVIPRDRLAGLLEDIRTRAPIANLAYWVEPVESFGRLAQVDAPAACGAFARSGHGCR